MEENKPWVDEILKRCGAIIEGHFYLTSGRHSRQYLEKAEICADPIATTDLCWEIACNVVGQFKAIGKNRIEVVAGLAPIGVVLANRVAEYLGETYHEQVISVFAEKDEKGQVFFRRGYAKKIIGKRVLIVDDVLTTGKSIEQIKRKIDSLGGQVAGAAVFCQRGPVRNGNLEKTPVLSLYNVKMEDWTIKECPLCKENIPLEDPKLR